MEIYYTLWNIFLNVFLFIRTDAMKPYLQGIFVTILICLTSLIVHGESREIPQEKDCELIQDDGSNNSSQITINGTNSDRRKLCFKIGGLQISENGVVGTKGRYRHLCLKTNASDGEVSLRAGLRAVFLKEEAFHPGFPGYWHEPSIDVQVLHIPKIGDDMKDEGVWNLQLRHSNGKSTPQYRQHSQIIYSYSEVVPASVSSTYTYFENIGYYRLLFDEATTWDRALEICSRHGAHLAVINSLKEAVRLRDILISFVNKGNNNRYNVILKHFQAYVGLRYEEAVDEFVTIFDEPLSATGFTAWGPDSPSDDVSSETGCVTLTRDGYMQNVNCSIPLPYFCEFEMVH
uniref:C-type lectin domain-containing protein n=1 Tax=Timema monikensis TaxID=170555 RepID=A0A7R9HI12_9NEOP|nr:unnamed protein product [Timema monikensis]